jgi:probable rRNA maturation factor
MSSITRDAKVEKAVAHGIGSSAGATRPRLALTVQYAVAAHGLPARYRMRSWVKASLERDADVTLRLVDADEGRMLNRDYRGRDYATNVLTFAYPGIEPLSGDIVLCTPVIAREAREQNKALEAHYAHLVVHGMLHLQGYDHESETDARVMESLEAEIVTKLGYPDPYQGSER